MKKTLNIGILTLALSQGCAPVHYQETYSQIREVDAVVIKKFDRPCNDKDDKDCGLALEGNFGRYKIMES